MPSCPQWGAGGDQDPRKLGGRERLYLTPHCHHQNDSCIKIGVSKLVFYVQSTGTVISGQCIKTGSDESHFNVCLTPSLPHSGLKSARTCLQAVYFLVLVALLLPKLCVVMKISLCANAKKKAQRVKDVKFHNCIGRFQVTSWQWKG